MARKDCDSLIFHFVVRPLTSPAFLFFGFLRVVRFIALPLGSFLGSLFYVYFGIDFENACLWDFRHGLLFLECVDHLVLDRVEGSFHWWSY